MRFQGYNGDTTQWRIRLLNEAGEAIGTAEYNAGLPDKLVTLSQSAPHMRIEMWGHVLETRDTNGNFREGRCLLYIDGQWEASFRTEESYESVVSAKNGQVLLEEKEDSFNRRLRWACRHGLELQDCICYANWGGMILGRGYAIASCLQVHMKRSLEFNDGLFNAADEALIETLPVPERLALVFIALRNLTTNNGNRHDGKDHTLHAPAVACCPDIPSTIELQQGVTGQELSLNPADLPRSTKLREIVTANGFIIHVLMVLDTIALLFVPHDKMGLPIVIMVFLLIGRLMWWAANKRDFPLHLHVAGKRQTKP